MSPYFENNDSYVARVLEYQKTRDDQLGSDLVREFEPLVFVSCQSYFLVNGGKEDLLQEGRLGLFKAMRDFRAELGIPFYRFAMQCIQRQCVTAVKSSLRFKHLILNNALSINQLLFATNEKMTFEDVLRDPKAEDYENRLLILDDYKHCRNLLKNNLSAYEYDVLISWTKGMQYEAIAKHLNRSCKSVDNALQRAKRHLKLFNEQDPDFLSSFQNFLQVSSYLSSRKERPLS